MVAAEARSAQLAAGVRDNLRIVICTTAARWALVTARFPGRGGVENTLTLTLNILLLLRASV